MLEKGWKPRFLADTLRKDFIDTHSTALSFNRMHHKVKNNSKQVMNDTFEYEKQKWDKSHKVPDLREGDLALFSTLNFNNIKGPKKLKYLYVGPFSLLLDMEAMQFKWNLVVNLKINTPPSQSS
ncbi:hypothetical protein O181_106625 [Austropuccinia psidii MF-1]|uniref:Uncharacterized protein n=1 Tax=Austropuccinia psidii MF-1 TaxID=1389203 RepID=A0A9Q3JNX5_9BASI|nr:hypothetical protein [Austropuccinia psidii MF-1]